MSPATISRLERLATHPSAFEAWERTLDDLFAEVFRPAPIRTVSEWAADERVISKETASEPGPWQNRRTPYLVEPMDALSDPEVTEIVFVKPTRIGYTEGLIGNGIGYFIDQDPAPILVIQPTNDDAEDWSKKHLAPMLRDTPALARRMPRMKSRDSDNTILSKMFPGGSITIRGAHSPRGLRRLTARIVFFDEVSAYEQSAGVEGDPVKLGETRADTFPNRKIVKGSTPTVAGLCRITKDFQRTDKRYYYVPCPHCDHEQVLRWGGPDEPYGIKWEKDVRCHRCHAEMGEDDPCPKCGGRERDIRHHPDTAYYLCGACGTAIDERHKPDMVRRGRWIPTNPESKVRGYHINALYSLISDKARWPNLVREWLEAQEDVELLQVFVNTVLAEAWEERGDTFSPSGLAARVEDYRAAEDEPVDVPHGAALLTAAVDVQETWLELLVRGWGAREVSWLVAHHRIYGDTKRAETWARLEPLLVKPYVHASGAELRVACCAIDSGHATDTVYSFVLPRQGRNVYAVKGKGGPGEAPIRQAQKVGRDKVRLYTVGVDTLKDTLFARLKIERPGPGYMHFCVQRPERYNGADAEYFEQFGAEKKIARRVKGSRQIVREYVKIRDRNEATDLEVYAMAALHILGAGAREELGRRAKQISEAGPKWKESYETGRRKKRRMISPGVQ